MAEQTNQTPEQITLKYIEGKNFFVSNATGVLIYDVPSVKNMIEVCLFSDRMKIIEEKFTQTVHSNGAVELTPSGEISFEAEREKLASFHITPENLEKIVAHLQSTLEEYYEHHGK